MPVQMSHICDYEGSTYRTDFWEGKGRDYEDRVERIALRRLLPVGGQRLLEIGAGFGRLTDEYRRFAQIVLLDYSLSQLQYAQAHYGASGRYVYVAADAYKLPFAPGAFDAATMIRVIHHIADVPRVLSSIWGVMSPGGVFILEHANKRNFKAILRYALRRQTWSPYNQEPVEFVELNFDFHPAYIVRELNSAGFNPRKRLPVSFFRLGTLKRYFPVGLLAGGDRVLQYSPICLTPSIFVKSIAVGETENNVEADIRSLFVCPECHAPLDPGEDMLTCPNDGLRYAIVDGIYDFKTPLS